MSSNLIGITSFKKFNAKVAELVDALASGASTARRKGSSPFFRTTPSIDFPRLFLENHLFTTPVFQVLLGFFIKNTFLLV
jgi:hypothetical protein